MAILADLPVLGGGNLGESWLFSPIFRAFLAGFPSFWGAMFGQFALFYSISGGIFGGQFGRLSPWLGAIWGLGGGPILEIWGPLRAQKLQQN